jgi:hypothetical protein
MLIQTEDRLYDIDLAQSAYRVVEHEAGNRVLGTWVPFDKISPVRAGEPLQIFTSLEEAGRQLLYTVVTTAPVTSVLAA